MSKTSQFLRQNVKKKVKFQEKSQFLDNFFVFLVEIEEKVHFLRQKSNFKKKSQFLHNFLVFLGRNWRKSSFSTSKVKFQEKKVNFCTTF